MQGFIFSEQECRELSYLVRCELDELHFDLQDPYLEEEQLVILEKRYRALFHILTRLATQQEILPYIRNYKSKKMD